jgi:hypothetical protein
MDAAELTQKCSDVFRPALWLAAFIDAVECEEITVTVSADDMQGR